MKLKLMAIAIVLAMCTVFTGLAAAFDFSADTVIKQKGAEDDERKNICVR